MKNETGFTLIELLAVIVILAVVAMITTPIILGIVEDSKEKANRRSVDGIIRAGELYLAESFLDPLKADNIKNEKNLIYEIVYEGKRPEVGQLYARLDGKVALAVKYGEKCYRKGYEGNVETLPYDAQSCRLNATVEVPEITIQVPDHTFNENGWAKENFTISVRALDHSGWGANIQWCASSDLSCDPLTLIEREYGDIQISQETEGIVLCAQAVDKFGGKSEVVCSEQYKLDKTAPILTGIDDMTISEKNPGDFRLGVGAEDHLSGIQGEITYSPTDLDLSKARMEEVEYRVSDNAGNIGTASRSVRIETDAPTLTFTPSLGAINANGWARENFYVTVDAIDHSKTGIKEIYWCGTVNDSCTPSVVSANLNAYIQSEGAHHRICGYAVDHFGQQGETVCSELYKLDKTAPEFAGISDIYLNKDEPFDPTAGVTVSDALSGIDGAYSYEPNVVDTSKAGEIPITYKVSDRAGNQKEMTRKVIIETENPTISFQLANASDVNSNGWAKSNFYVNVIGTDYSGHGINKIVWCGTTTDTCTPATEVAAASQNVLISQESSNNRICGYAVDNYGKQGSTTCSDLYKLDKTAPSFNGLTALSVGINTSINLTNNVTAQDNLSGISGSFTYSPSTVDLSSAKTVTVTYRAEDLAGNVTTVPRSVTVIAYTWRKYNAASTVNYHWDKYQVVTSYSKGIIYGSTEDMPYNGYNYSLGTDITVNYDTGEIELTGSVRNNQVVWGIIRQNLGATYPYMEHQGRPHTLYRYVGGYDDTEDASNCRIWGNKMTVGDVASYSRGSYIGRITNTTQNAYPSNGKSGSYWYIYRSQTTDYSQGTTSYGTVVSGISNAYPTNGRHSDGYWYVKVN